MDATEADARIILSRQTLHRYSAMVAAGETPAHDMQIMADEIGVLERIAEDHPIKAEKVYRLGEEWLSLMASIRAKLN
jgi:hypothetical protein